MRILHTEWSTGWGGQEIRILREMEGMRARGHHLALAVNTDAKLATKARQAGFPVYEFPISKRHPFRTLRQLIHCIKMEKINIVNTHSSVDSWLGGIAARLCRVRVIRTRHLSAAIKPGLNSFLLYRCLADAVATTCESIAGVIQRQARLKKNNCVSIPTGIDPADLEVTPEAIAAFKEQFCLLPSDFIVGTLCVLRSWKGIQDLLQAAKELEELPHLKWLIVGGGPCEELFKLECKKLNLERTVLFTGHLEAPFAALAAMDIFLLLSRANEGVSQATLQAAYLEKPLITTRVGGLGEVCIDEVTGYQVDSAAPTQVAEAVKKLLPDTLLRLQMGQRGKSLVTSKFTWTQTLDAMEKLYST